MEKYTFLRQMADSWMLLALVAVFGLVIFWAYRPGSRRMHDDTSQIPFRNDEEPVPLKGCSKGGTCADCPGANR